MSEVQTTAVSSGCAASSSAAAACPASTEWSNRSHTGTPDQSTPTSARPSRSPGEPVALHGVADGGLAGGRHRAVVAQGGEPHADHADAPVPQAGEVPGQAQHRAPVVDADPVDALDPRRLVADHRGHRPFQHGEEVRVVLADGVDDEAVDARAVHRGDVHVLGADRDEQQALTRLLAGEREALRGSRWPRGRGRRRRGPR